MPTSTTRSTAKSTPVKTYSKTEVEKACDKAAKHISDDLGNSVFHDAAELTCKLYTKYLKEELFK